MKLQTRALLCFGVLFLACSAVAFSLSVGAAAENELRLQEHLWAGHAYSEFRPSHLSVVFDWLAFGGGLGGLFALAVGLARFGEERVKPQYRVGPTSLADFSLVSASGRDVPLVEPAKDAGFVITVPRIWDAHCQLRDESIHLSELEAEGIARPSSQTRHAIEFPVAEGARIRIQAGRIQFLVNAISGPRRQGLALLAAIEMRYLAYLAKTTAAVVLLMLLLDTQVEEEMTLYDDAFASTDRLEDISSAPADAPIFTWQPVNIPAPGQPGGSGTRMAEAEGRMGAAASDASTGRYAIQEREAPAPQLARQQVLAKVREAGVLGVLARREADGFMSITAAADFSSGLDESDVYGGLEVNAVGEMQGGWGYGLSASGPGGGGTGWGTIGAGNYGTIGHGRGSGSGYGVGHGNGGTDARQTRVPDVHIYAPSVIGDLDSNISRRYIRRRLPRIRHCYEKALLTSPNLVGTVSVRFQISPQGLVVGMTASGLGNTEVESCVANALRSIRFPKPRGGGYVQVHYPFTFTPSGD